jgi:tetratricopeptide (TPR) repeat protein
MKKILIAFALIFLFLCKSFACLNGETTVLKDGTWLYTDRREKVPYGHRYEFDVKSLNKSLKKIEGLYKTTKDLDYLSDKGLILILLKKYDEAIKLYLEIEKKEPGRYSTASNIGTAYELAGQNENALQWIKRAVEIDPSSHDHSEWLHVKILEAKINGELYYNSDFLLNLRFGSGDEPISGLKDSTLQNMHDALYYQLNERVSFIKTKDDLVAELLFDLGNFAFELGNYDDARHDYELARRYGYEGDLIDVRTALAERLEKGGTVDDKKEINEPVAKDGHKAGRKASLIITIFFILVATAIYIYKSNKNRSSRYRR